MNLRFCQAVHGLPLLGAMAAACGGEVDLGGRANTVLFEPEATPPGANEMGEALAQISPDFLVDTMAVAGEFLFLGGLRGATPVILRCHKRNCRDTAQFMSVAGRIVWMQPQTTGLGAINCSDRDCWLGTYALPNLDSSSVAIRGLPDPDQKATFHEDFVFWSLFSEGIYRCRLPSCGAGPERVSSHEAVNGGSLQATSELLFWTDTWNLYRAADLGAGTVEILVPDDALSVVPERNSDFDISAFAVTDSDLYVASRCNSCGTSGGDRIISWPVLGGPGRVIGESTGLIAPLVLEGRELAWVEQAHDGGFREGTLFTCLHESCAATKRQLGSVALTNPPIVSDGTNWYWHLATSPWTGAPEPRVSQLRRVPLLPQ